LVWATLAGSGHWEITYLRGPIRGAFFYLYLIVDVWSRKQQEDLRKRIEKKS
jgi:hypothetical protein